MFAWPDTPMGSLPETDQRRLRNALGAFPTGVCLVTTVGADGKREGMTVNSFASVSLAPPLILWSVREAARSADVFLTAPYFVLSVLAEDQRGLAAHFARPSADKFAGWDDAFEPGLGGCPRLRSAVSTYECRLYSCHREGDHSVLVGRVDRFEYMERAPLVFHGGRMGSMEELAALLPPASGQA